MPKYTFPAGATLDACVFTPIGDLEGAIRGLKSQTGLSETSTNQWRPMNWKNTNTVASGSGSLVGSELHWFRWPPASPTSRNSYLAFVVTESSSVLDRGENLYDVEAVEVNWLPLPIRARSRMSVLSHGGRRR